eukprot:Nitzschia sp. Nitz4//scaffold71_size96697//52407//56542//NITZ4_004698-RA/size96697-augustus-gene-0.145-mRNA-1//1//CDS//3329557256//4120//frame0
MSSLLDPEWLETTDPEMASFCPCPHRSRSLEDALSEEEDETVIWQVVYTCVVLFFMFGALVSDFLGADSIMMVALTAFMAAEIISISEGLAGFSNEGLLTVLTLFVVADGISKTGALDWYMGKLLGRPETVASAQLRLMLPIAIVSAFLNNTPVVAVMIPIVQKWAKNIHMSAQQLLVPLSFASILGGTCTLIGTSTNLVVAGLLTERYPDDPDTNIGLFDLGRYGVPIALAGICYMLLASPRLLPGGAHSKGGSDDGAIALEGQDDILIGARLTPWSPAAGRSVKRSGLRDTGGIFLVSVHRAATGNVHRAVGQEFVLNVGDILYFTGLVDGFGEFCEEHGLEIVTNELDQEEARVVEESKQKKGASGNTADSEPSDEDDMVFTIQSRLEANHAPPSMFSTGKLEPVAEGDSFEESDEAVEVGTTKESLVSAAEAERSQAITRMIDAIRGVARNEPRMDEIRAFASARKRRSRMETGAHKVVVTSDHEFVVVGIDTRDRAGLLLDISKGLVSLRLNLRHTEAKVVGARSISIWRCELKRNEKLDLEEIWTVLNSLLEASSGSQAVKQRGIRVIRAGVTKMSSLIGKTVAEVHFREKFRAAVVGIQKGGRNVPIGGVLFAPGDVLILQVGEDSPLLRVPPENFYKQFRSSSIDSVGGSRAGSRTGSRAGHNSVASLVKNLSKAVVGANLSRKSSDDDLEGGERKARAREEKNRDGADSNEFIGSESEDEFEFFESDDEDAGEKERVVLADMVSSMNQLAADEDIWRDLQVVFPENTNDESGATREFLAAMQVAPKSKLINRTVAQIGLDKLPGVFLVSIDRPNQSTEQNKLTGAARRDLTHGYDASAHDVPGDDLSGLDVSGHDEASESASSLRNVLEPAFTTIVPDTPLQELDVLWFAGSASAVGDLRKIPGLISYESDEVKKMNENIHDRRLVEAVVARRGPLVGKTVKEVRFRTRFGAAVIAVHREGKRIHEHPGKIKLHAGDVLLLEAGPTFIKGSVDRDGSFALLAEVEDSAPPRLSLLIPALVITVAMLAVFTAGIASLLVCSLIASFFMVALGILSEQEARDAVNWEVYITIAAAFGIGTALVNSGVAGGIANFLVSIGEGVGLANNAGLLGAVYFATFLISNVVTNNAAAALMFPIAMDAAEQSETDALIMCYCIMLGASASFMSPFGYTTNLLIYGPGGYKYNDFVVIGTPMQLFLWILSIAFLATTTSANWWISWLITGAALAATVAMRTMNFSGVVDA